ncbi:unnamed protein product [Linum trigynum]|uniref:Uncharacterized protein n=1 Tax=Linum trigynum TaxID=586398 RepID=A0AAV2EFS5_9ROSI
MGLPAQIQRSKVQTFQFVEDNLVARIQSWRSKALSLAAKEVIINVVGSTTPVYVMFSFRIPTTSCRRLNSQLSRYWWAGQDKDRGMHWISWPAMCVSKFHGGLGFRDFDLFNVVMLAKQVGKIVLALDFLLARVYKARYHPSCDFLNASAGSRPSWARQGVLEGRGLLKQGLRWQVGVEQQSASLKTRGCHLLPRLYLRCYLGRFWRIISSPPLSIQSLELGMGSCFAPPSQQIVSSGSSPFLCLLLLGLTN